MEKKIFGKYELIACTAIPASIGETGRVDAILVRDLAAEFDPDCILFGYGLDEMDGEALADAFAHDSSAFSAFGEDLETVMINGLPLNDYCSLGEI